MSSSIRSVPCAYCGLPARIAEARSESKAYCCLGCRIASGIVQGDGLGAVDRSILTRLGLAIFFTMNVMVFTLVLWTWNVHPVPQDSLATAFREILRYACLFFSTPVLFLLGGPIAESSFDAIRQRRITTDVLLLLGVAAAYAYSVGSLWMGLPDVYFEVACMILVAVTLGKWFEASAKAKATQAMRSLRHLLPETARVVHDVGEQVVSLDQVRPGHVLRVLAGERIPVDGVIASDCAVIDEQTITGESIPVRKEVGSPVFAGTVNQAGELQFRATRRGWRRDDRSADASGRRRDRIELDCDSTCRSIGSVFGPIDLRCVRCGLFRERFNEYPGRSDGVTFCGSDCLPLRSGDCDSVGALGGHQRCSQEGSPVSQWRLCIEPGKSQVGGF